MLVQWQMKNFFRDSGPGTRRRPKGGKAGPREPEKTAVRRHRGRCWQGVTDMRQRLPSACRQGDGTILGYRDPAGKKGKYPCSGRPGLAFPAGKM
ncbi:hypothetical protein DESPIG_02365 [Desulfovibrio piger ATCC 29098]|uniref:Uncharacterized protein n=1 Tax=Desulfovibrio piger ATCC 29098 TaxID=411464 RepID=B6WW97_9BACT|nr:hypothetical protein DESPIG_02365 [Desulfovibrio piger ATCC 29098]